MAGGLATVFWAVVKVVAVLAFIGLNAFVLIWGERKVAARFQRRRGPETAGGPWGLLQSLADGLKLFAKEDVMPAAADRWVWALAPAVMFVPAAAVFLVLPVAPGFSLRDLNIGVVYIVAVTSFTAIAYFMAGWGSNNKYSLLGAMRSVAQLVSYEIPLVMSIVGVVMAAGSFSLQQIVKAQSDLWFIVPQFLGFVVFYVASLAELNRIPFDLVTGESELVAGYLTEYSGIRWAMFMFAEYTALFTSSAVATSLFLGGWHGPLLPGWVWFLIKTYALIFVAMWIRWTLPRVRIDQVLDVGWKFLLPVSLLNVVLTGAWMTIVR
ncbi:MAG: NADH-quinone oxidoreductase subunit NuoH [Clostridia bacterium]|nr:NADH-quinone oxidoreductase subunit NuoH [Clostridia bacterium]